eukprot:GHVN01032338.1.p2 GENE.GHVN01032338.1~~GHVN01032338.1.p2  ORF type:complete len:391 (-),score=109.57 GHVN01032338.1:1839-3011(-)
MVKYNFGVDHTPADDTSCGKCKEALEKGAVRMLVSEVGEKEEAKTFYHPVCFHAFRTTSRWWHENCPKLEAFEGVDKLSDGERTECQDVLDDILEPSSPPAKKARLDEDDQESDDDADNSATADRDSNEEVKAEIKGKMEEQEHKEGKEEKDEEKDDEKDEEKDEEKDDEKDEEKEEEKDKEEDTDEKESEDDKNSDTKEESSRPARKASKTAPNEDEGSSADEPLDSASETGESADEDFDDEEENGRGRKRKAPKAKAKGKAKGKAKSKAKAKAKAQTIADDDPGVVSQKDFDQIQKEAEGLQKKTIPQLKAMLQKNRARLTGKKDELVMRVAEHKVLGVPPKCSSCGGGLLNFTRKDGMYRCPGYYDDGVYQPCRESSMDAKTSPWND